MFISHAASDKELARQAQVALENEGFETWLDESCVLPGESWANSISDALQRADAYIVLVTKRLSESSWATVEVGAALASGKPVIPILAEDGATVPSILRDRICLDVRDAETRPQKLKELAQSVSMAIYRHDTPDLRPGIELVDTASRELGRERISYETTRAQTLRWTAVFEAIVAISGVVATAVVLAASQGSTTPILAGISAGVLVAVAAAILLRLVVHAGLGYLSPRKGKGQ